ncbi:uncharacterized protein TRAVEDRAFT_79922, partial [Trametes versicolor FP-101664 SS1]|uniref:uncharacterized protein n=1 Tax=Trametes versicolor (strain FP-101664) TaxID=717944 RepID=UPI0004621962
PAKLERPYFTDVSPEKMVAAQPGYEGLLPKYVRSGWSHVGYRYVCLKMYRKIFIDPPKTALPEGYNLAMSDGGIVASATHIFGVYALAPPGTSDPAARRRKHPAFRRTVDLYPTHGAIWSAYCARLPTMAQPPAKAKVYNDPRPGTRTHRASVLRLPIVPVAVPHPPSFYALMQFVYSYRKSGLINALVPCEGFALPPDQLTDPPPEVTLPAFAQALAQKCTLLKLCQMAKNVHGAYRNMICLGVVEPRMWDAIDYAWAAVLAAMDLVE